jgi:2,4-dienoyl-CoA reductase-like NADH-dependent reductase (Old Yellow Enzyme family)
MSHLFEPLTLRGLTLRNRIMVSPMCQYSSEDGFANDWHLVHLGSRATGGAGLVFTEATAVTPGGRISAEDLGLWKDDHVEFMSRITRFVTGERAAVGIQLAHAGRKASTARPWLGGAPILPEDGGWLAVAPSPLPFDAGYATPAEMSECDIASMVRSFRNAASRSLAAGFEVVEIHSAHGYLLHEFLSPLSNQRTDRYGGTFENRTRAVREVVAAVREVWPERFPLFLRISATDWLEGGWDIEQSVELARQVGPMGVDLIDCSSGALAPGARMPIGPGYQTSFAERVRRESGVPTGAVGMITSPEQADHIIRTGQADAVLLARELLRDPYWPRRAAKELGQKIEPPSQYGRAWN